MMNQCRYYNWSPTPNYDQAAMDGLEYVPMFWGNKSIPAIGGVQGLIASGNVTAVLGMNECVHSSSLSSSVSSTPHKNTNEH